MIPARGDIGRAVLDARGVRQEPPQGDRQLGRGRMPQRTGQVLVHVCVQIDLSRLRKAHDGQGGDMLADRGRAEHRIRRNGHGAAVFKARRAIGKRAGDSRIVKQRHRRAHGTVSLERAANALRLPGGNIALRAKELRARAQPGWPRLQRQRRAIERGFPFFHSFTSYFLH